MREYHPERQMKPRRMTIASALIAFVCCTAISSCGEDTPDYAEGGTTISVQSPSFGVYQILKATGNSVEIVGDTTLANDLGKAKVLSVNGAVVFLFEYDSKQDADKTANAIAPDGSSINQQPIGQPTSHNQFFRTDRVIILYEGINARVSSALETAAGQRFAGK